MWGKVGRKEVEKQAQHPPQVVLWCGEAERRIVLESRPKQLLLQLSFSWSPGHFFFFFLKKRGYRKLNDNRNDYT